MGQRLPMGPQGPASGTLDAPLTQNAAPSTAAPSTGKSDMIRALKDTVRYLRSASTDPSAFVDPRSYHGDGSEDADVMEEMLTEMQALKSRDAASATVLRMAKENLEQRKEQISQLQAELASRAQIAGSTNAELAEQLRQKENELRVAYSQELAGQGRIQQLQGQVDGLQADLDTRRQQDAHMKNMLNEMEAQRGLHLEELEKMRRETQRLLAQKGEEMDRVLQEAAQEVEAVRAAMNQQAQADPTQPTIMSPPKSPPMSAQGPPSNVPPSSPPKSREASRRGSVVTLAGGDQKAAASLEVDRLKEALADVSTDLQEREQELSAAQDQLLELQKLLKQQSDMLNEVREREEELAKERDFLAQEGGNTVSAIGALQQQVARQKATITTLQDQIESLADQESELTRCKQVIAAMERHKNEVDGLLDEVQEDRNHRDAVIAELKKLRTAVQQKDALIAELNEQLHSVDVRHEASAPSIFKVQQMQRDIQELRTAVQRRDALIADLNARMEQDGQGGLSHASNLAERERALTAQTEQLQLVSQHQFEMQGQLAAVQKALQEQQYMLAQQAVDAQRQQQQSFQLAAQAQQLAALQQGINSMGRSAGNAGGGNEVLRLNAPESQQAAGLQASMSSMQRDAAPQGPDQRQSAITKMPTAAEWSQSMGVQAAEEEARKARNLARSAAAAAAVARRQSKTAGNVPTEVTM